MPNTNNHSLEAIREWGRRHVSIDPARIRSMVGFTSVVIGEESSQTQELLSKISLWLFSVDDVFDSNEFSLDELRIISKYLIQHEARPSLFQLPPTKKAIIEDIITVEHELTGMMGIRENKEMRQYWQKKFSKTVLAMLEEAARKNGPGYLSIEEYLETARDSVAFSLVLHCLFYTMDKTLFELRSYPLLNQIIEISAEVTRLLNDLQTYQKELNENKTNSVHILQHGTNSPDALISAVQQVNNMIEERMLIVRRMMHADQNEAFQRLSNYVMLFNETTQKFYAVQDFK